MLETTTKYKDTPIGKIPVDWEVKKLGDLGKVITGNTPSRNDLSLWNGSFCWATAKDFKSKYIYDTVEKITEKGCNGARLLPKGSILITCIASIGNNAIAAIPLATNQQINSIIVNDNVLNEWLYYQLSFYKRKMELLAGKTAVPLINKSEFEKIKLPIPSLPEQQKIAEVLSTWDKAIKETSSIIKSLEKRNKALAFSMLTGKKRLKEFQGVKTKPVQIKDIAQEISLKNKSDEDYVVFSCTKYNGLVPSLEYFGKKIYSENLTTYKIIKKNQFAYATNHIEEGSMGILERENIGLISPMYTVFDFNLGVNRDYIFKMLKTDFYINEYKRRMEGSIDRRGGLRWSEFSKINIYLPSLEEQNKIAEIVNTANEELQQYQQKLNNLKMQKKGLMQKLLTGKVRVKF